MPTTRPRYLLTESDELREALEVARHRWPDEDRPTALLLRLIDEGRRVVDDESARRRAIRLEGVRTIGEGLEGVYSAGYLDELRRDWPA